MQGVFTLTSARDLLTKLEHDYELLAKSPNDPYCAFNFFVTAEHMLDWVYPGNANRDARTQARQQEVLLQVCSHLASGAKHFQVEAPHHTSVKGTVVRRGNPLRSPLLHSPLLHGGGIPGLCINLEGDAKDVLGTSVRAAALAKKVLDYWHSHEVFASNPEAANP